MQVARIIADICHLDHLYIGGEKKSVMWRNFRFQYMTHAEKSEISPHEEEFQFFHTTDVEKCEFLPNLVKFHISPQADVKKSEIYPVFIGPRCLWGLTYGFASLSLTDATY